MEASALPRSTTLPRPRLVAPAPLLRVRSDDQLVALFRTGSDEAFRTIHDRYRVRLLAYARQMLGGSTADAEDVLQEVFVRAHAALLASSAPISLRAWLYRIAHNRCVDQLRRPSPIPSEIMPGAQPALSRGARHDPPAEAERSEDLRRLVADVHALPEQQRSALLMRELQGLSYEELAVALGISVAAVKSVLLRARSGVLDAAQARDASCLDIRLEIVAAHDRGVRTSGRARRHMRECDGCCAYRVELRAVSRRVAALVPVGPLGQLGLILGIGGGGAGAGGGLAAGGSTAVLGSAASATATKVAALVCCAALVGSADALRSQAPHHSARGHAALVRHAPAAAAATRDPRVLARLAGAAFAPTPAAAAPARRAAAVAPGPPAAPLTGQDAYGSTAGSSLTSALAGATATGATGGSAPDPTATGGTAASADPSGATPTADATTTTPNPSSSPDGVQAAGATPPGASAAATASSDATPAPVATATSWRAAGPRHAGRRRAVWSHSRPSSSAVSPAPSAGLRPVGAAPAASGPAASSPS